MDSSMDNFKQKFIEEAVDLIDTLEKTVLELEENPGDIDIVQRVFRIMHTLKGNSSMFGYEQIDRFTHHMETIYDLVRSHEREVNGAILDVTLRSVDHLKQLLHEAGDESPELMAQQEELMGLMDNIIEGKEPAATQPAATDTPTSSARPTPNEQKAAPSSGSYETFYVRYAPVSDIFNNGTNPSTR